MSPGARVQDPARRICTQLLHRHGHRSVPADRAKAAADAGVHRGDARFSPKVLDAETTIATVCQLLGPERIRVGKDGFDQVCRELGVDDPTLEQASLF